LYTDSPTGMRGYANTIIFQGIHYRKASQSC
jgi:hypothetical protein